MLTRRDLGKYALAALPAARAFAKINSKIDGVQIGAQSYSFRDRPLDEAIKAYAAVGLGEAELYQGHVEPKEERGPEGRAAIRKWRLETPLSYFRDIRKKFDQAGILLYAYNLSFRDDYSDEEFARGFEMAKAMGVKYITASSTLTAAKRLAPFADKARMVVAMHGHSSTENPNEFSTPESFQKAMQMSRYFAVNLDIGHFFAAGFDPVDYIQKHHDRIATLHIKDRKKDKGPNMPFGQGDTPIKPVLQLLKEARYNIPANIEYEYQGGDTVEEVRKCYEYCKQALA